MSGFDGLRVGVVGPVPPPAGGMAMQTRQLVQLLDGERAKVSLVQTNRPYRPAWIGRFVGLRALFRLVPYMLALWRTAGRVDVLHVMANSGWSWHLFAVPAVWIARFRSVRVIVNYRGGEAASFLQRSAGLVRATVRRASSVVVPSEFLREVFGRHGMAAQIVPNVVDLSRFHPGPRAEPPQIIVARNLEPIYDNATALRAFAMLRASMPGVRLLIAGTGPQEASLRALAAELGVTAGVSFVGRLSADEMALRLRESAVALNPSTVDNMPNSVLEAMASGVPVVSTDVGGIPFIVSDQRSALLVPAGDAGAMARALERVLRDAALADKLRRNGLQDVLAYTWPAVRTRLGAAYGLQGAGR